MRNKLIAQLIGKISLVYQFVIEFLKVTPEWMTLPITVLLLIIRSCCLGQILKFQPLKFCAYTHEKFDNCPNLLFFFPDKPQSKCFPFDGSHSANQLWHADSHPLVGRFIVFTRRCLTNLSGVPSVGQRWECIKTVKMAAVTSSWHSLHLGMMSKYDIAAFCSKRKKKKNHHFAAQTRHRASAAAACECHAPPTRLRRNLHLILLFAATSIPLFIPLDPQFPLSPLAQPSLLFLAELDLFCSHNPAINFSLFIPFHLFCSQSICLHVSSVFLLSKYSCQLLH